MAFAAVVVAVAIWVKALPVFLLILFMLYAAARFSPRWVAVARAGASSSAGSNTESSSVEDKPRAVNWCIGNLG